MAIGLAKALEFGASCVAIASAGNAGAACSAFAARAGIPCLVLVPETTPRERLVQIQVSGALVAKVAGSTREAAALLSAVQAQFDLHLLTTASPFNPYQAEGIRSIGYEILEESAQAVDWVIAPIGGGGLIAGLWRAFTDLRSHQTFQGVPRLLGIQAAGCAPLVRAYGAGPTNQVIEPWATSNTIVASIADPVPYDGPTALKAIRATAGSAVAVDDEAILAAQSELALTEGLFVEPASAATVAGLEVALKTGLIQPSSRVVLILSGAGFKDFAAASRSLSAPPTVSTLADLDATLHLRSYAHPKS